jgi:thiosulfate/3-mercaptopyruvate sulfurtransferase
MDSLVTTEWLAAQLGAPDLKLIDATAFLPEHGRDAAAEYAAAHIPGAVFLDHPSISDPANPLPSMLAGADAFAARMGALGIGPGDRVVIYDDSPIRTAARAWWAMRTMGLRSLAILDGGLAKWKAEGRPIEAGVVTPAPAHFTANPDLSRVRDRAAITANLDSRAEQLVDARGPARFAGDTPEARPGLAAGHIPGSLNLPYARLFEADGTMKRGDALAGEFAAAGIDLDRPIATTCGSGVTAAVLVFGLHLLGRDAALYDGSWTDWGSDPATPKATGA